MPYAPTVNDISGQILAQGRVNAANAKASGILGSAQAKAGGIVGAANLRLQGTQALASGIGSAGSSIAGGIAQAGQIYAQNKAILSNAYGKIEAFSQAGYLTPAEADQLSSIKDPNKLAGALAVVEQNFASDLQRRRMADASRLRIAEELFMRSQSKVGQPISVTDPTTGEKQTFVWQNDSQIVPLNRGKAAEPGVTSVLKKEVGPGEFIYVDQNDRPINPNMIKPQVTDPVAQANVRKLTEEKAALEGRKASGEGDKSATWWPWSGTTVNKRLQAVDAQLNTLRGGGAAMAEAKRFSSAAEVRAAVQAGTISRAEAIKILRDQFGMK